MTDVDDKMAHINKFIWNVGNFNSYATREKDRSEPLVQNI